MKSHESSWKATGELDPRMAKQQTDDMPLSVAIMIGVRLVGVLLLVVLTVVMQ